MTLTSSPVQIRILTALTRYKFLTIAQLVQLRASDEKTVRTRLQDLRTAKLIDRQEFQLGPSAGRLPNIHWLTEKGIRALEEMTGETARASRGHKVTASHAWHRILNVSTLIAADQWAAATGQSSPMFSTYMQRNGDFKPTALNLAGKDAEADAILRLTDTAGHDRVYVIEIYCSQFDDGHSTKPVMKLEPYVLAGGETFDEQLLIPEKGKAARLLVICDTPDLRDKLLRTLPKRDGMPPLDRRTWQRLHFKAADELSSFGIGWHKIDGSIASLPT